LQLCPKDICNNVTCFNSYSLEVNTYFWQNKRLLARKVQESRAVNTALTVQLWRLALTLALSLSVSVTVSLCLSTYTYIYIYPLSLSFSLSLYIYIYIYIYDSKGSMVAGLQPPLLLFFLRVSATGHMSCIVSKLLTESRSFTKSSSSRGLFARPNDAAFNCPERARKVFVLTCCF
jgi:hypothetical protein